MGRAGRQQVRWAEQAGTAFVMSLGRQQFLHNEILLTIFADMFALQLAAPQLVVGHQWEAATHCMMAPLSAMVAAPSLNPGRVFMGLTAVKSGVSRSPSLNRSETEPGGGGEHQAGAVEGCAPGL